MGPSFLGVEKEKACYRAASSGFEHGAFGSKPLTFIPEPIAIIGVPSKTADLLGIVSISSPQSFGGPLFDEAACF